MRRVRLLAVAVVLVALVGACRVDAVVRVEMDEDGSGTVTVSAVLDREAVATVEAGGGALEERIRLDGLTEAGWSVGAWERRDGVAAIELSHDFAAPEEAGELVASLNGTVGPVPEVVVTRRRGTWSTDYRAEGVVDLAVVGSPIGEDEELRSTLEANGVPVDTLELGLAVAARTQLAVTLDLIVPDDEVRVRAEPGERADGVATSSVLDLRRVALLVIAGLLVLAAVVVVARGTRRRGRAGGTRARGTRTV